MKRTFEKVLSAFCSLITAGLFLLSGCATSSDALFSTDPVVAAPVASAQVTQSTNLFSPGGVIFQVGDQITVTFSDTMEPPPPHEERIKEDGTITLPMIGAVRALGKTPGDLQKEIHEKYVPKYYLRLTITVKYQAQELSYSVLGEVRVSGPKSYLGVTTVTKAIGAAGGLTDYASKRKVWLTRANGTKIKINYTKAVKDPKSDPQVFPGDSINVERSIW